MDNERLYSLKMTNEHGFIIRYKPYLWEENCNGEMYHNHFNRIDEFFTDEIEFNERVNELENNDYFEDLDGHIYDGVDIEDLFVCDLQRITSRQ